MAGGSTAEQLFHAKYHAILRMMGRFRLPESPGSVMVLTGIAKKTLTFIDVGANVGLYSWFVAHHGPPGLCIYAFEPNPQAYALLKANLDGLRNVECFPIALAADEGPRKLHVPVDQHGNPLSALGWIGDSQAESGETTVEVSARSLDTLVRSGTVNPTPLVFLKIDVEGAEVEVLRGAAELIRRFRPVVYFECQEQHLQRASCDSDAVLDLLAAAGYTILVNRGEDFEVCLSIFDDAVNYLALPVRGTAVAAARLTPQAVVQLVQDSRGFGDAEPPSTKGASVPQHRGSKPNP